MAAGVEEETGKRRRRLPAALPALSGRGLIVFRLVWLAALAVALTAPVAGAYLLGQAQQRNVAPFAAIGLEYQQNAAGELRLTAARASEARASGIRDDDLILSVEGQAAPSRYSDRRAVADLIRAPPGPAVTVETRSADGTVRTHRLSRDPRHDAEIYAGSGVTRASYYWIVTLLYFLSTTLFIAAAILLFRRRARDPVAALLSLSFLLLTSFGQAGYAFQALGLPFVQMVLLGLGWTSYTLGVMTFPEGRFEPRWTLPLAAALVVWAILFVPELVPEPVTNTGLCAILLASVAALIVRYRRLPTGAQRQQIRWVLLGFATGLAFGIVWNLATFLPLATEPRHQIWLSLAATIAITAAFILVALGLLVSLLKYRLYDADAAISRSAGYAVLTLLLAATFGASAKAIEWFFETSFGRDAGALPGAIGAGLAVVLITPMHRRIQDWAERRFQKALLRLRRDLPECVGDLRETAGMGELLGEVLARVEAGTRAVRSAVAIGGETVAAHGDEGDYPLSVPLRIGHQETQIGTLLVGPRPDGSAPGKDEREALAEIADPVARAVRIVAAREAERRRVEARADAQDRRVAALEQALSALGAPRAEGNRT